MGTRNLTAVQIDGEYKIAQYGQWDGYPSGQGHTILEFLKSWDRPSFEEKLRASAFVTDSEIDEINRTIEREGLHDKWQSRWPTLTRDAGAEILGLVARGEPGIKLKSTISFAAESLFCEWAYVLDLDTNKLEVFRGFNQSPLTEEDRFFGIEPEDPSEGYHGVKLAASYDLSSLPTVEQMERDCLQEEEEEGAAS